LARTVLQHDPPVSCPKLDNVEVYCASSGLVGRLVGTTKRCLRKVLGQSSLTNEQLNTTLISIEAAVNSRPITQSGDSEVLPPGHFLIGGDLTTIPTGPEPETRKDLTKEFRSSLKLSDDFWKLWQEYLLQLEHSRSSKATEVQGPTQRGRGPDSRGRAPTTHVEEGNSRRPTGRERSQGTE
jgi:hypothetical protein